MRTQLIPGSPFPLPLEPGYEASHNHDHLMSFMRDYNLICADLNSSIKYTYRRDDCSVFSWPDHVLTLAHHAQSITRVSTLESVDNFSDHLPLVFTLDLHHHLSLTPNHTTAPSLAPWEVMIQIMLLSLVGMTLLVLFVNLPSFGIEYGLSVAVQYLGCYFKLKT